MSLERYCACGATLRIKIPPEDKALALALWFAQHDGPRCRPATRMEAMRSRAARAQTEG